MDNLPATILWVEDEQHLREILAEELEDAGYEVVQAVNGQDALLRLRSCRPDLILCDIAMPAMDGYELLREIRETMDALSDVPFVFLSAQNGQDQIIQGKYAGADDYLVKPVNFELMLATIAARIRQVRRVREKLAGDSGTGNERGDDGHDNQALRRLNRMFNLITAGVVLLDREGKIQYANTAAQRLMQDCVDPMGLAMFNAGAVQGGRVSSLVRDAIKAGLCGRDYTEFLSLSRRNGQRDLLVTICALDGKGSTGAAPVAALFICADGRDEPAPLKALESLFRLTPAEGRVAWAFAQGLRPDQIAETFDISLTTVAFHKRNIFQKTYTNRQADLIALLLTLPASAEME